MVVTGCYRGLRCRYHPVSYSPIARPKPLSFAIDCFHPRCSVSGKRSSSQPRPLRLCAPGGRNWVVGAR
jgi:hypothetical protein